MSDKRMTDQVFRSGCGHTPEDEQFDFCPICRIRELEEANIEQALLIAELKGLREPKIQHLEQRISELEEENAELKCEWMKALRKLQALTESQTNQRISELEREIARIAAEARDKGAYTWATKLEALK